LYEELANRYESQTHPIYGAARLWVDAIIDPVDTRHWIGTGIQMANHAPVEDFRTGVIQT
jgi:acetyl-CoA carboxylase carboxyltransferase component